jgi:lipopolysaccharide exporter
MTLKQRAFRGGMWIGAAVAVGTLFQVLQLAILARILDAREIGLLAIVVLISAFLEIFMNLGISNSIVQRKDVTRRELSSLHWLNVSLGLIIAILLLLCAPYIAVFFEEADLAHLLVLLSFAFVISPFGQVYRATLEKSLDFKSVAVAEILGIATTFAAAVALALAIGTTGVVIGMLAGYLLRTAMLITFGWRLVGAPRIFNLKSTQRFLSFGLYQSADAIVGFVGANAGVLVIGKLLSTSQLGGFNLASNFAVNAPAKLNPVVTRVMFPALSSIQDEKNRLATNSLRVIMATGIVSAPLLAGLALVAPEFVGVALGSKWAWTVPLLQVLAFVGYVRAVANPMGVILMSTDKMRLGLVVNCAKTVITIPAVIWGAAIGGSMGVAYALAGIGVLTLSVNFFLMRSILGVRPSDFWSAHVSPLLHVAPMAFAVAIANVAHFGSPNELVALAMKVTIGAVVFALTIRFSRNSTVAEARKLLRAGRGGST